MFQNKVVTIHMKSGKTFKIKNAKEVSVIYANDGFESYRIQYWKDRKTTFFIPPSQIEFISWRYCWF